MLFNAQETVHALKKFRVLFVLGFEAGQFCAVLVGGCLASLAQPQSF